MNLRCKCYNVGVGKKKKRPVVLRLESVDGSKWRDNVAKFDEVQKASRKRGLKLAERKLARRRHNSDFWDSRLDCSL